MRALAIANTAVDLLAQDTPFLPGQTVVATGANGLVVQGSEDAAFTTPVTLVTLSTAAPFQTCQLLYRYVRVSTAAPVCLLNN